MKTLPLIPIALLAFLAPSAALQVYAATDAKPARAEVIFSNPENFTDVKDRDFASEKGRDEILGRIKEFIVYQADAVLPAGQKLIITFTDIDLAGDFEPWRGPSMGDVRIVKAIYPPRFKFNYKITDDSGRTLKEGDENLTDLAFDQRLTMDRQDTLRYEKSLLGDWLRSSATAVRK